MPDADIEKLSKHIEVLGRDFPKPKDVETYLGDDLPEGALITAADKNSNKDAEKNEARWAELKQKASNAAAQAAGSKGRKACSCRLVRQ